MVFLIHCVSFPPEGAGCGAGLGAGAGAGAGAGVVGGVAGFAAPPMTQLSWAKSMDWKEFDMRCVCAASMPTQIPCTHRT